MQKSIEHISSTDESVDNDTFKYTNNGIPSSNKVTPLFAMVAKTVLSHSDVQNPRGLHDNLIYIYILKNQQFLGQK